MSLNKYQLFIIYFIAGILSYFEWMPKIFYGDDLFFYDSFSKGECATQIADVFTSTCADKYRPIPALFYSLEMRMFGVDAWKYFVVNIIINSINGVLFSCLVWELSKKNIFVTILLGLCFVTSRFNTFPIVVANGPYELLAIPAFIFSIWMYYDITQNKPGKYLIGKKLICALVFMVLVHERYLVMAVPIVLVYSFDKGVISSLGKKRFFIASAAIGFVASLLLFKKFVLSSNILVGTGGREISLDLDKVILNLLEASLSIVGFNYGPNYLVGLRLIDLPLIPFWILAAILSLSIIIFALVAAKVFSFSENRKHLGLPSFVWVTLFVFMLLLVPPIMTIRMEQRWLFMPFAIVALLGAWLYGNAPEAYKRISILLIASFAIASITLDHLLKATYGLTFYGSSSKDADVFKKSFIDNSAYNESVFYLPKSQESFCTWVLGDGQIFKYYARGHQHVYCGSKVDFKKIESDKLRIVEKIGQEYVDISSEWNSDQLLLSRNESFNFLKEYSRGIINNSAKVDTPSGLGAFLMDLGTRRGVKSALVLLPGISYKYEKINIKANSSIIFDVGLVYPVKTLAAVKVHISRSGAAKWKNIYNENIKFEESQSSIGTKRISIELNEFQGEYVDVIFESVNVPNSSALWVGFINPRIVN